MSETEKKPAEISATYTFEQEPTKECLRCNGRGCLESHHWTTAGDRMDMSARYVPCPRCGGTGKVVCT